LMKSVTNNQKSSESIYQVTHIPGKGTINLGEYPNFM
jgi:hypothetical protein